MKTLSPTESFNELVFENRNKEYGAYAIRSSYNQTVAKSLSIVLGVICVLLFSSFMMKNNNAVPDDGLIDIDSTLTVLIDVTPPVDIPIPEKLIKNPEPPKSDNINFQATDKKDDQTVKPVDLAIQSNSQTDGKGADSAAAGTETHNIFIAKPKSKEIVKVPDQMPSLENMSSIISKILRYPPVAVENATSGMVYVTFVVETDGSVSNIQILKGIGDGCEEEAIRVVKALPKWKAGIKDGETVRTQCNLPIRFSLK